MKKIFVLITGLSTFLISAQSLSGTIEVNGHGLGLNINNAADQAGTYINFNDHDGKQAAIISLDDNYDHATLGNSFTLVGRSGKKINFFTSTDTTIGSQRLTILNNGNIGIGTSEPNAKLNVLNSGYTIGWSDLTNSSLLIGSSNAGIGIDPNEIAANGTDLYLGTISEHDINFRTNGLNTRMFIDGSTGYIGVGNIDPAYELDINGRIRAKLDDTNLDIELSTPAGDNGVVFNYSESETLSRFNIANTKSTSKEENYFRLVYQDDELSYNGLYIKKGGNIGVGVNDPSGKLEVYGNIKTYSDSSDKYVNLFGGSTGNFLDSHGNGLFMRIEEDNAKSIILKYNGSVGIGTNDVPENVKLGVNGRIAALEVKVAEIGNWSDFVFEKDYNLPTLKEVEDHIQKKGHLENIPSAEEVSENGFYLGEMDAKLLQKIEELTLYTIEQEKKIEALEKEKERFATYKRLQDQQMELLFEKLRELENKL